MRSFLAVLMLLGLASCAPTPKPFEFCSIGASGREARDSLVLNTDERTLRRAGALYDYVVLESEVAKGFVVPFPLTLPKHSILTTTSSSSSGATLQWEFDTNIFSMTPLPDGDPDWVLINSSQTGSSGTESSEIRWSTSVLYSVSDGVLAIRAVSEHGTVRTASMTFFCGTSELHASSF